jgi:predicted nucleic acid-binding protein
MAAQDEGTVATALDSNVIIALWDKDPALNMAAQNALDAAFHRGTLVAAALVLAELIAAPGRNEAFVNSFFEETGSISKRDQPMRVARRGVNFVMLFPQLLCLT